MTEARAMRPDRLRYLGVAAAVAAAVLYLLIGVGVLSIGTAASGQAPDLLSFGLLMGVLFGGVATLLVFVRSRAVWLVVGLFQVLVIVGYFAMSGIRTPAVEPWGLLVKACQAVVLVAVALLALGWPQEARR